MGAAETSRLTFDHAAPQVSDIGKAVASCPETVPGCHVP